ncbi:MAG: phytoene/squalene synthase family protein [Flavobacteriales bacterium]|nr:phytoene/squalene synthase family protein [Flavobacteriales bacterium]MCX7768799.1 phytoene/squalene synthase family protein [Flavobacteriales bacterium]MDW8410672.1 phytoene/squalene synthase family protein [Flavobacteriales bacterium]
MDAKHLFDSVCREQAALLTRRYSTSFSLGIRFLAPHLRPAICAIYSYVRVADEIVDTFHDHDKRTLLQEFARDTYLALERGISTNPVLHAFQRVVHQFGIERELIDAFLESMAMDLEGRNYNHSLYQKYIYGSAEVVGLMCLHVFCEGNKALYEALAPAARSLGAAFQKVNFLRDMRADREERGRVYFPGVDFEKFSEIDKRLIEEDIERDFNQALEGLRRLPPSSRRGVYLAYRYYYKLFRKLRKYSPEKILTRRVRIANHIKMIILLKSVVRYRLNWLT